MMELVQEIRRLRKENKKLIDDLRIANSRLELFVKENAAMQKRFDEFKASSDIFGGIFDTKRN
jgi:hypothetical protein